MKILMVLLFSIMVYPCFGQISNASEIANQMISAGLEDKDSQEAKKDESNYYLLLGEKDFYFKNYKESWKSIKKSIKLYPNNKNALILAGDLYYETDKANKALKFYNQAASIGELDPALLYKIGVTNLEHGNYLEAIENFTKAINTIPNNPEYHLGRANAKYQAKMYGSAIEDFDSALSFDPGLQEAYRNKGYCYTQTGNFQLALENLSKAIEINPNDGLAFLQRGLTYIRAYNNSKACEDLTIAVNLGEPGAQKYYKDTCK